MTSPLPAGRYSARTRPPGTRRRTTAIVLVASVLFGAVVAVLAYRNFDTAPISSDSLGFSLESDSMVTVRFNVTRDDPGKPAVCIVRALSRDGSETGRREVYIPPADTDTRAYTSDVQTSHPRPSATCSAAATRCRATSRPVDQYPRRCGDCYSGRMHGPGTGPCFVVWSGYPDRVHRSANEGVTTMTEAQVSWLTHEAHERLKVELDNLIANRPLIAEEINDRREEGDLKENGGYHAAREEQGQQERRIRQLQELLNNAKVGEAPTASGVALPGSVVKVYYDGDESDSETFLIATREEGRHGDLEVYSPSSPLGKALLDAKVGETREYALPNGSSMKVTLTSAEPFRG